MTRRIPDIFVQKHEFEREFGEEGTVPMILFCPNGHRHIDEGHFLEKPHHTHACQTCGIVWRPAVVNTHGVQFLPGYLNEDLPG